MNAAHNLARWLTRDSHEAEDVVQEAYLRAFRFFDGFQAGLPATGGDGRAWLLAVVRNTCFTWLGRSGAGAAHNIEFNEQVHTGADTGESTEEALVKQAKIESLRDCVAALPAEYREAIVMRELEEFSYREISQATGTPLGTVMSRLSRGRVRLFECMEAKA